MTAEDILKLPLYTKGSDERGHSVPMATRVPNGLSRIIREQAESPDTPYKTLSDYVRDALFTFTFVCPMKYLTGDSAVACQRLMEIERNRLRLASRLQLRTEAADYAEQIAALCRTSATEDAEEAATSVSQMVRAVKDDPYAARCYLGCLQQVGVDRLLTDQLPADVRSAIQEAIPPPEAMRASSALSGAARAQLRALNVGSDPY
jgi:hypothetical protein